MDKISISYFKTSIGELILGSINDKLCLCDHRYRKMRRAIDKRLQDGIQAVYFEQESITIALAKKQINEYLKGERRVFDLPLKMIGTTFQQNVWSELLKIPFGETESYLGLAKKLKKEKAVRAVAAANGANAISIIIPCHRIIGSNGELVGYAGGLPMKKKLLELEGLKQMPEQLELF